MIKWDSPLVPPAETLYCYICNIYLETIYRSDSLSLKVLMCCRSPPKKQNQRSQHQWTCPVSLLRWPPKKPCLKQERPAVKAARSNASKGHKSDVSFTDSHSKRKLGHHSLTFMLFQKNKNFEYCTGRSYKGC